MSTPASPTPVSVVDINGDGRSDLVGAATAVRICESPCEVRRSRLTGSLPPQYSGLPATAWFRPWTSTRMVAPRCSPRFPTTSRTGLPVSAVPADAATPTGSSFEVVPGKLGEWRPYGSSRQPVYLADLDGSGLPDFVGTAFGADEPWSYRLNTGASGADRFAPKVRPPSGATSPSATSRWTPTVTDAPN